MVGYGFHTLVALRSPHSRGQAPLSATEIVIARSTSAFGGQRTKQPRPFVRALCSIVRKNTKQESAWQCFNTSGSLHQTVVADRTSPNAGRVQQPRPNGRPMVLRFEIGEVSDALAGFRCFRRGGEGLGVVVGEGINTYNKLRSRRHAFSNCRSRARDDTSVEWIASSRLVKRIRQDSQ